MIPEEALEPLTARRSQPDEDTRKALVYITVDGNEFEIAGKVIYDDAATLYSAREGSPDEYRAKLFAASPDLYKALKRIVDAIEEPHWAASVHEAIEAARPALLLAERPIGGAV